MSTIQLFQITPDELQKQICAGIKSQMQEIAKQLHSKSATTYLTRQEVADMFAVSISTVHNWSVSGKLKRHGIGNRVYFLRTEVEQCLTPRK